MYTRVNTEYKRVYTGIYSTCSFIQLIPVSWMREAKLSYTQDSEMLSSWTHVTRVLFCVIFLPSRLPATSLSKFGTEAPLNIDATEANKFLTRSQRSAEPKWFRKDPDFQSYYHYYSSIGHLEGLYEIDKIQMSYQQMRQLEQTYGPDAALYQNLVGQQTSKSTPPSTTQPPPPVSTPPPALSLSQDDVLYLCNSKDPLCKPRVIYAPTGAVIIACDPRFHPGCKLRENEEKPSGMSVPAVSTPPTMKNAPPVNMEYDCDPYWDPDCLIDHPPRPMSENQPPVETKQVEEIGAETHGTASKGMMGGSV